MKEKKVKIKKEEVSKNTSDETSKVHYKIDNMDKDEVKKVMEERKRKILEFLDAYNAFAKEVQKIKI